MSYLSTHKEAVGSEKTSAISSNGSFFKIDPTAPAMLASKSASGSSQTTIFPITKLLFRQPALQTLQYRKNLKFHFMINSSLENIKTIWVAEFTLLR